MNEPVMRASHLQAYVASLECLGAVAEWRVRDRCRESIAGIDGASRLAWLPLQYGADLIQNIEDECGREMSCLVSFKAMERSAAGTLFGPILSGLVRLGMGPQHGFGSVPRAWTLVHRHCGSFRCESSAGSATLHLASAPKMMRAQAYMQSLGAGMSGIIPTLGGELTDSAVYDEGDEVRFEYHWQVPEQGR